MSINIMTFIGYSLNVVNGNTSHFNAKTGNQTTLSNSDGQSTTFKVVQAALLICFMFGGFIGNTSVCVFMSRTRELRTRTNVFYVSLSVANLGIALIAIPFTLSSTFAGKWALGNDLCRVNGVVNPFWISASCLSVTATTIHKYFTITRPMKHQTTRRKVGLMICAVWITSALISIWPILHRQQIVYKPVAGHCGYSPTGKRDDKYYLMTIACAAFLCPTLINSYCYARMFRVLNKHRLRIKRSTIIDVNGIRAQRRNIVTLYVVFIVFFITWLPVNIYSVLFVSNREDLVPDWALAAAYICTYSICVQIPVVIICRSAKLRSGFKRFLASTLCKICFRTRTVHRMFHTNSSAYDKVVDRRCSAWYIAKERRESELHLGANNDTFVTWSYVNDNHVFDESKL